MSRIERRADQLFLDERAVREGDELELRLPSDRWLTVRLVRNATPPSFAFALGGEWERPPAGAAPIALVTEVDLDGADFRWGGAGEQLSRVQALERFLRDVASSGPPPQQTIDLEAVRADRQFRTELPAVLADYERRFRDHSFDLFHAAARFATQRDGEGGTEARAELERAAIQFEDTSRWLAALRIMESEPR